MRKNDGRSRDFDYSDDEEQFVSHVKAKSSPDSPPESPALPAPDLNETAESSEVPVC